MKRTRKAGRSNLVLLYGDPGLLKKIMPVVKKAGWRELEQGEHPVALLAVSANRKVLLDANRVSIVRGIPAFFVWPSGRAGFSTMSKGAPCPCLECFEVLNPKVFSKRKLVLSKAVIGEVARFLSEALRNGSPSAGNVRVFLEGFHSFSHPVSTSLKCPVRLLDEGFSITP